MVIAFAVLFWLYVFRSGGGGFWRAMLLNKTSTRLLLITSLWTKGKTQLRALVLDTNALYKLDPLREYKMGTKPVPLTHVDGVSVTSNLDPVCVLHLRDNNDIILYFAAQNRIAEFVTRLVRTCYLVSMIHF